MTKHNEPKQPMIAVGQPAPNFTLPSSDGRNVQLADFRGSNVLIYFYPKDLTPACTTQACDFRDKSEYFAKLNTVILGISMDSIQLHHKFISQYGLPFLLLSDEDHSVAELYGVWRLKKLYGREYIGIERSSFLIDSTGILLKEWRNIRVKGHVERVLLSLKTDDIMKQ